MGGNPCSAAAVLELNVNMIQSKKILWTFCEHAKDFSLLTMSFDFNRLCDSQ